MELHEEHYISEGGYRTVYNHPENSDLCIKIPKPNFSQRQLKREFKYLKKHQDDLPFLSKYHGSIATNLGIGYIFGLIKNADGTIVKSLSDELESLDEAGLKEKIYAMYECLLEHRAPVEDLHTRNLVIRRNNEGYDLMMIDGFGNSDFIKACDYSKGFLKKKLIKKFNKLTAQIKLDIIFN